MVHQLGTQGPNEPHWARQFVLPRPLTLPSSARPDPASNARHQDSQLAVAQDGRQRERRESKRERRLRRNGSHPATRCDSRMSQNSKEW
jgi:hypothetical protein